MKVKCIKASVSHLDKSITNGDMNDYLNIGDMFYVFGLSFYKAVTYIKIYHHHHLVPVPLELFEIINDKVPNEWQVKRWDYGEITFWPDLFYRDKFFEDFSERETWARKSFDELRVKMENQ